MTINKIIRNNGSKQRLTSFVDPVLIKRAKVRGALEGLTMSEVVEKALEAYSPKIENGDERHIHLKFNTAPAVDNLISGFGLKTEQKVPKRIKALVVPR